MTEQNTWPLPRFYFDVSWDGVSARFQEVSGLDMNASPIEYRAGNSKLFSTVKMPGLAKSLNITLKKGIFDGDDMYKWFDEIQMNTITRKTVIISLIDEAGSPSMIWELENAFPTKVAGTDLKSDRNETSVDLIELVCEGLTTRNGTR